MSFAVWVWLFAGGAVGALLGQLLLLVFTGAMERHPIGRRGLGGAMWGVAAGWTLVALGGIVSTVGFWGGVITLVLRLLQVVEGS